MDENYTETAFYEESKGILKPFNRIEVTSLNENDTEWYKKWFEYIDLHKMFHHLYLMLERYNIVEISFDEYIKTLSTNVSCSVNDFSPEILSDLSASGRYPYLSDEKNTQRSDNQRKNGIGKQVWLNV